MSRYAQAAGQLLRQHRQQRQLTLREVAPQLHRSVAALSRAERGEEALDRTVIQRVVEVFQLSPWEAQQLWLAAGFVPEAPVQCQSEPPTHFESLLSQLSLPAFVIDDLGYLQAWNQEFAALWHLDEACERPHLIGHLFSNSMRTNLGEEWANYTRQWMAFFQHKTWCRMHEPRVQRLWAELVAVHGGTFSALWEDVQRRGVLTDGVWLDGVMVVHHPEVGGECTYLVLQPALQGIGRELYLYVHAAEIKALYSVLGHDECGTDYLIG
jgi:transcriptional regulator with XRE-family HTH domain